MKRTKYDAIVSDLVRERAHWTCENCEYIDVDGQAVGKSFFMQASHFRGRGAGFVERHSTTNVRCLCAPCHKHFGERPDEHTSFLKRLLGDSGYDLLLAKFYVPIKITNSLKSELLRHYKSELLRLRTMRHDGKMGYIEVADFF